MANMIFSKCSEQNIYHKVTKSYSILLQNKDWNQLSPDQQGEAEVN